MNVSDIIINCIFELYPILSVFSDCCSIIGDFWLSYFMVDVIIEIRRDFFACNLFVT